MKRILLTLSATVILYAIEAQGIRYSIEFNAAIAKGHYAPFWHVSNRQGVAGVNIKSAYTRASIGSKHIIADGNWSIDWCADAVIAKNHTSKIFIQQAFADINWRMLSLSLGQKERQGNLKYCRLSTGALTESSNARPIPQIRIEIPEYWDIFSTNGWFTLRGHIAYGWFTDEKWQEDFVPRGMQRTVGVRYHSKSGFFKIGNKKRFPITYEFGLEMAAQFGGTVYNMKNIEGSNYHNPSGLKDYYMVFIPTKGDDDYHGMDRANIAGNQLGSWHTAITWHSKQWMLKAYYEHAFEDHSQMFWEYGLWTEQLIGISLQLKRYSWITDVTIEYFNLKNHSGPIYHDADAIIPDQISSRDNNYNHGWYNGWFNYGMIIGSPLCTSPIYNRNGALECKNNRVEAYHIGIEGWLGKNIGYRTLLTKSNNWGTYNTPFTDIKKNLSGLMELTYIPHKFQEWSATLSFAFDKGTLYGNNIGGMLTIRKIGIINI